jgi:hypothetical protein
VAFGGPPLVLAAHGTERHAAPYVLLAVAVLVVLGLAAWGVLRLADRTTARERDLRR